MEVGMAVYVVTWDLNKEKPNYSQARTSFLRLVDTFENLKDTGLDSVRFVSTRDDAEDIVKYLRQGLDDDDRLVVSRLRAGEYQGWLAEEAWDWITARA
jgi:hypothetical protein